MRESHFRLTHGLRWRRLHREFGGRSMIGRRLFTENLALAQYHLATRALRPGCYVECGTWAGGLSFAMMQVLPNVAAWHLFDSFAGLPTPSELDGPLAFDSRVIEHNNNSAGYADFMSALERLDRSAETTTVHKGWFSDTLPAFDPPCPISILRLDGDWYESIAICLEHLFDKVQPGGLVILDDYDDWLGCRRAVHDFLSARKAEEAIRHSRRGVPYFVKV